ncbi:MAG: PD-(D/E)XK nuclease family protein [Gemmatimonadaceae bacterium]
MSDPKFRLLFHGPFGAGQSDRARDILCEMADTGARDILYVVANGAARRAVIADLVRRRGAIFGMRVVTLQQLPFEIERRARVIGAPVMGGVLQEILVEHAVRSAMRTMDASLNPPINASLPVSGVAAAATRTITAVERAGGTRESLAAALLADLSVESQIGAGPRVLINTWAHLDDVSDSRTRTVAQAVRSAIALLRARADTMLTPCSLIVLEDLPLHGPLDRDLIASLLAAAGCSVVATSECAGQLSAGPASQSHALLRTLANWNEQRCERTADPLSGAGDRLFRSDITEHELTAPLTAPLIPITRLEAAGDAGEVRLAARIITRHLRENVGEHVLSPSDILVIVPRSGRYRDLICEIFAEKGIPTTLQPARSAATTALGSVLLELLDLAMDRNGGTREVALALARSPHIDVRMHAADRLEQRVVTRGYLGLDGWDELAVRTLGPRATNRVNRLKRTIASARDSLVVVSSGEEVATVVRHLAKELRLVGNAYFARRRIAREDRDDTFASDLADTSVREDNQTWEVVERVLDETMPALLRASSTHMERGPAFATAWLSLFRRALDSESPGRGRPSADAVRVGGTAAGDGQPAQITIILGLQQKTFPQQSRQDPFLRDAVKYRLARCGIALTTSEDAAESERESFVRAVSTARDALYLSSPATDAAGKPTVVSFFLEDFQQAVGAEHRFAVERMGVTDVACDPEDAASRAELLAAVAHGVWQRLPATAAADRAAAFAAWNQLAGADIGLVPVAHGRVAPARPSFDASLFANSPHGTLELSASQLKSIGHCTFQHFVHKVLDPEPLDPPGYGALEKGSLVHSAMMQWVRLDGWERGESALPQLDDWFAAQAATLPPAARDSALARFTLDHDRGRLLDFIREELTAMNTPGTAQPMYNELAFGGRAAAHGDRDPASVSDTFDLDVATSGGERTVRFTGSVDRVDVYEDAGELHGIAIDYKTGNSSEFYAKSMLDGTDLQLRLYLLAIERLWGVRPAGALYIGFGDGVRRGAVCEDAAERIGRFETDHVKVLTRAEWNDFVYGETTRLIQPLIDRLVTLDITALPHKRNCGFCDLGAICRYLPYDTVTRV